MVDPETIRIASSVAIPQDEDDAFWFAAHGPCSDEEALTICVLNRLAVDGVIA